MYLILQIWGTGKLAAAETHKPASVLLRQTSGQLQTSQKPGAVQAKQGTTY